MSRFLGLLVLFFSALILLHPAGAGGGKDKKDKKDNPPEVVGVVRDVNRDGNPKDKDIGYIIVDTKGPLVKIIVMKGTDLVRNGKKVEFKALDKGDLVAVQTTPANPFIANKIVIRKE